MKKVTVTCQGNDWKMDCLCFPLTTEFVAKLTDDFCETLQHSVNNLCSHNMEIDVPEKLQKFSAFHELMVHTSMSMGTCDLWVPQELNNAKFNTAVDDIAIGQKIVSCCLDTTRMLHLMALKQLVNCDNEIMSLLKQWPKSEYCLVSYTSSVQVQTPQNLFWQAVARAESASEALNSTLQHTINNAI